MGGCIRRDCKVRESRPYVCSVDASSLSISPYLVLAASLSVSLHSTLAHPHRTWFLFLIGSLQHRFTSSRLHRSKLASASFPPSFRFSFSFAWFVPSSCITISDCLSVYFVPGSMHLHVLPK